MYLGLSQSYLIEARAYIAQVTSYVFLLRDFLIVEILDLEDCKTRVQNCYVKGQPNLNRQFVSRPILGLTGGFFRSIRIKSVICSAYAITRPTKFLHIAYCFDPRLAYVYPNLSNHHEHLLSYLTCLQHLFTV